MTNGRSESGFLDFCICADETAASEDTESTARKLKLHSLNDFLSKSTVNFVSYSAETPNDNLFFGVLELWQLIVVASSCLVILVAILIIIICIAIWLRRRSSAYDDARDEAERYQPLAGGRSVFRFH